jgi:arabinose-5-phosphate isomerase
MLRDNSSIILNAKEAIDTEINALAQLSGRIDENFALCVHSILNSQGRVVITGIGKSAAIAQKIVGTLNSTGTPSIFMHAADAVHGDLGIIQQHDVVICISKSGNTPEIKVLVPLLRRGGNVLIALVGNIHSFLAEHADFVLDATVDREACPNDLAPTSSTTAQLVLGDALAICLLKAKSFGPEDFARYHPGGALGKRLYLTLSDLISSQQMPAVSPVSTIKAAIDVITRNRLGAAAVIMNDKICGIITDGDIRRMLEKYDNIAGLKAENIMGVNPFMMDEHTLAVDAAVKMTEKKISQIIVTRSGNYAGMVHIHDLNREGIL